MIQTGGPGEPIGVLTHFTGAQHAWRETAALASPSGPVRAFVVGPAGSGKSTLLSQLQDLLTLRGVPSTQLDTTTDISTLPPTDVLLVDDLHLVDDERTQLLLARCATRDASIVVASRPWRHSSLATDIARHLERSAPPVVLGLVTLADVTAYLGHRGQSVEQACLDHLLTLTGGVGWLVSKALAIHESSAPCRDPQHQDLVRGLEARILHRLDTAEEPLRRWVELSCVGGAGDGFFSDDVSADDRIAEAYAEGLLLRNGSPVPVVRSAVRGALPAYRVLALGAAGPDADGVPGPDLVLRRALAAWHAGALDQASSLLDALLAEDPVPAGGADVAAAVWAARGLMATGSSVYSALPPDSPSALVRAAIAHVGAGFAEQLRPAPETTAEPGQPEPRRSAPCTLDIALQLLDEGLRASLLPTPPSFTVTRLVRASELYTSSHATDPLPELPAVIAASVALGAGELSTAQHVIDAAVAGGQGGRWARRRLLLWQAFVALQGERPSEARASLEEATALPTPVSARDELMRQTILVTLARRYQDLAALEAAWAQAHEGIRHIDVDLYTLLPLSALVSAAARVGDATTLSAHFAQGLALLERLGSPPLWSLHLRWAGVQQGILLDKPELLGPHAKALVVASTSLKVADVMAHAGGIWVSVLSGNVEPDSVEEAAKALSTIGLAWDGARLAAHGAGRATDRRVSARLLTVARLLHPTAEEARRSEPASQTPKDAPSAAEGSLLSDRELDVALLVMQGKTYAEIGQTIFISPRTVEHHVSHIKRRLSVTSRSDLIAKLRVVIDPSRHQVGSEHR
ncbi:LuxR family transcriptional regulator [Tessaracoccus sp. MC1679]|uniref:LuxR C-terminal-related transcriptional regulator n=1 Tax=Tessaracoccus sp. MC1679 TaxID=2760313 RepID=UPI0016025AAE|nr:LuxR family transcriptional regulator [Tessaracoccus sp. MC1679]